MKLFIAYRHSGEDPDKLQARIGAVCQGLEAAGQQYYCTLFDEEQFRSTGYGPRAIMEHAFETIESCDGLLVVLANQHKSEGMLMEVGRFYGHKPIFIARHFQVRGTYLPDMATHHFKWRNHEELASKTARLFREHAVRELFGDPFDPSRTAGP